MLQRRGIFRYENALTQAGQDPLELPVVSVQAFEFMLRRSGVTNGSTREYVSQPESWPMAGFYDEALLYLVLRTTDHVGGVVTAHLYFEDSSDATNWAEIGYDVLNDPPDGTYVFVVSRPFGAWVRIRLVVEKDSGGVGLPAFLLSEGVLTFKRKRRSRASRQRPSLYGFSSARPPAAYGRSPAKVAPPSSTSGGSAGGSCGCSGGGSCGCGGGCGG